MSGVLSKQSFPLDKIEGELSAIFEFQVGSGVTKLRILSGLLFSRQSKAVLTDSHVTSDAQIYGDVAAEEVVVE